VRIWAGKCGQSTSGQLEVHFDHRWHWCEFVVQSTPESSPVERL